MKQWNVKPSTRKRHVNHKREEECGFVYVRLCLVAAPTERIPIAPSIHSSTILINACPRCVDTRLKISVRIPALPSVACTVKSKSSPLRSNLLYTVGVHVNALNHRCPKLVSVSPRLFTWENLPLSIHLLLLRQWRVRQGVQERQGLQDRQLLLEQQLLAQRKD